MKAKGFMWYGLGALVVELPPREVGEYLEVYRSLASAGLVPEAIGGGAA